MNVCGFVKIHYIVRRCNFRNVLLTNLDIVSCRGRGILVHLSSFVIAHCPVFLVSLRGGRGSFLDRRLVNAEQAGGR